MALCPPIAFPVRQAPEGLTTQTTVLLLLVPPDLTPAAVLPSLSVLAVEL